MSSAAIKSQLQELLSDPDNSVVALSGDWGTGKTHLWSEVAKDFRDGTKPLYVSLFGSRSTQDLQVQIVQAASSISDPRITEALSGTKKFVGAVLQKVGYGWASGVVEALTAFVIPKLLSNRLVVIDDIERKDKELTVNLLLGFIERYKQLESTRFLLILNRGQLDDEKMWATFREKVIDHEVVLDPTPSEAFDIALETVKCPYANELKGVVEKVDVKNIRIIQRILRIAKRVLELVPEVPKEIAANIFPSLVLLPAIYFKANPKLPTMEFVLSTEHIYAGNKEKSAEEIEWTALMEFIGPFMSDEFEKYLLSYLRTGLFDEKGFKKVLDGYLANADQEKVTHKIRSFMFDTSWNSRKSDADLLRELEALLPNIESLDMNAVSQLAETAVALGGSALADRMIDLRMKAFNKWAETNEVVDEDYPFSRPGLHPRLQHAREQALRKQHPLLPLMEVVRRIRNNSGWGRREVEALKASSKEQYIDLLTSLNADELSIFVRGHIAWLGIAGYEKTEGIKDGVANFLAACKEIVASGKWPRLKQILERAFQEARLFNLIEAAPGVKQSGGAAKRAPIADRRAEPIPDFDEGTFNDAPAAPAAEDPEATG
jgi:hypothetical protein